MEINTHRIPTRLAQLPIELRPSSQAAQLDAVAGTGEPGDVQLVVMSPGSHLDRQVRYKCLQVPKWVIN